ncbi:tat pathway signal sequence [Verticillium dahliae]
MASAYAAFSKGGYSQQTAPPTPSPTVTALNRWSILTNTQLPAVDTIKALHVYDFDNTLFKTPLPNPALWVGTTIGTLSSQDTLINGGWWHDSRILAATGEGADAEEKRAWDGWWNEKIVELITLSTKQKDALCVLLTGRSERGFSDLIKRMIKSKGLEFDMIGLKPAVSPTNQHFKSTMHFKQLFLEAMMETYKNAEEIRIYEDRPKHVKGFRDFMADYNRRQNGPTPHLRTRGPISAEVVQVADMTTTLDPVAEVAEVQHMINLHNEAVARPQQQAQPPHMRPKRLVIKKTVFFTGYMLDKQDTTELIKMAKAQIPAGLPDHELKFHANNILICPRPCPASILDKVGGMGAKMKWEVTGTACYENSIWAACLRPLPPNAKFHTDNPSPLVVLALRKGARPVDAGKIQNWQPVSADRALSFETTVGEKVILRIEAEDPREDEYESLFANKGAKRKHAGDEVGAQHNHGGQGGPNHRGGRNERRDFHSGGRGGRGGNNNNHNNNFRGGGRGGRNGGQRGNGKGGRGGRGGGGHGYRSLDDVEPRNQQGGYGTTVEYDEPTTSPGFQQGRAGGAPYNGGNNADLQNYY